MRALASVEMATNQRSPTGIEEFDRVLGGGLVAGGVVLLGGDPGIGKSTLLLQATAAIGASRRALYVTGEESAEQIALRANRLGLVNAPVELLAEVQLEAIVGAIRTRTPDVVVIDSIQTMYTEALESAPGSVAQVRECAAQLTRLAKQTAITVILVGHVTKEGAIAGPRVLEHIVDTVLYFEGDTHSSFRLVRAIKNRFGAANELGVFAMSERGLKGVTNPSALFLSQHGQPVPGQRDPGDRRRLAPDAGRSAGAGRSDPGRARPPARGRPRSAAAGAAAGGAAPARRRADRQSRRVRQRRRGNAHRRACGRPRGAARGVFVAQEQAAATAIGNFWRSRAGRRNPARCSADRNGCARRPSWDSGMR